VTGTAFDNAGNAATTGLTLNIDTTPPTAGVPALSTNPVSVSADTTISTTVSDNLSGVAAAEYFIGEDPGVGHGMAMSIVGGGASAILTAGSLLPGVYTVGVRSEDAAGNWSATKTALLVVYDPSGGFTTGGGWLIPGGTSSDSGDQLPGLDGSNKANFGFVVKYKNDLSTVPDGNLQFDYHVGDFHLHSTGMDWLVIADQDTAQFQGDATIDGSDQTYPFVIQADDGNSTGTSDRLTLRVYQPGMNPSAATVLYQASGEVQGGQIMIHQP
jgi:hypothetical protein